MDKIIIEDYLLQKKLSGVKTSTLANYYYRLISRVLPCFINGVKTTENELYPILEQNYIELSNKSYIDFIILMNDFLSFLYNKKYMEDLIKLPCPKHIKNKVDIFNDNERVILETYLITNLDYFNFGALLSLYTGIRVGELSALKHGDIRGGILYITKTLQRVKDLSNNASSKTKILIDLPKSEKSIRNIPLPSFLIDLYNCFPNKNDEDYLLTNTKAYIEPKSIGRRFKKILQKCNIDNKNFHITRHTFATDCIKQGFDIKTLSEILGHNSVKITLEKYIHSDIMIKVENMNKIKCKVKMSQSVQLCDTEKKKVSGNIFLPT
jgi:integrase